MFIVYTKQNCPNCVKAKALLDRMGAEYKLIEIVDVVNNPDTQINKMLFVEQFPGIRVVPFIVNGDTTYTSYQSLTEHFNSVT